MRLINTSILALEDFTSHPKIPAYATLSHRWQTRDQEVSYHDFLSGAKRNTSGWAKIVEYCRVALLHDLRYCWIDTCCINKESSAEESRSINSMFTWYERSRKAFVYLDDAHCEDISTIHSLRGEEDFAASQWFTRGWTLQELIAPSNMTFFNSRWEAIGTKYSLAELISRITNIPTDVLRGERSHLSCSVAQRMFWIGDRVTTVIEDQAYSLLGLFNVNMPLIYGEGEKAFMRLQEEIIQRSTDQTIFAWSDHSMEKGVLAPSPKCFQTQYSSGLREIPDYFPDDPASDSFNLGNAGLLVEFVLIPWSMNTYLAPLRCYASSTSGSDQRVCLILRRTKVANRFVRIKVSDEDLVLHRYLRVPTDPNPSYWDRSRLYRQIVIAREPLMKVEDCFYGFHFDFLCPSMFEAGSRPDATDVICECSWNRNMPRLQISHGTYRIAGIFRLSKKRFGTSFLVMGFDADFNPFCFIASPPFGLMKTYLPLLNVKRDIIDPKDVSAMSVWERSSWLDAMYLHKYIDELIRMSKESAFDWQGRAVSQGLLLGDRNTSEEVFQVPRFQLMVIFKLVESHPENNWKITFKDLPQPGMMFLHVS
ncbi:hypothetical protein LTR05_004393 [Lithohypha guttulata]|uniref:Heterokaryon incompatibility domain-containing protein n=1 Tax=Lithohypha guttulata TaxID=1690604 RepID=A0AAN7T3C5_9EURO|nr:hypothetical protein LTR05_004393 [Lithohypha guttulata]